MTDQITRERALDLLRQAVNQDGYGPDYVYPRGSGPRPCRYVRGGTPSCLVGHALHLAGVDIAALEHFDEQEWVPQDLVHGEEVSLTRDAAAVMAVAQDRQDDGEAWGEAIKAAEAANR